MKKLIIILGIVLVSSADALATDSQTIESLRLSIGVYRSPSDSPTQLNPVNVERDSDSLIQQNRQPIGKLDGDSYLIAGGMEPSTRPGTPDNRGGDQGNGSR